MAIASMKSWAISKASAPRAKTGRPPLPSPITINNKGEKQMISVRRNDGEKGSSIFSFEKTFFGVVYINLLLI
jgi:hypothetical protein